jgi:hypothetical protein
VSHIEPLFQLETKPLETKNRDADLPPVYHAAETAVN